MSDMSNMEKLKVILRESDCPFFEDDELEFYLEDNGGDLNKTAYQCLIIKSENTTLTLSGLEAGDTARYFRRLAQRYRENNSRILSD